MAEPLSTTSATTATAAIALLSLCPGIDAAVIIGAFAGAVVFVMSSRDLSQLKRVVFFVISWVNGGLSARTVAATLSGVLPDHIPVAPPVGALIAAAVSVKVLFGLIRCADHLDRWRQKDS